MCDKSCQLGHSTVESTTRLFKRLTTQLNEKDDIYPLNVLSAAVSTSSFVFRTKRLELCLETEEFEEFFKVLESRMEQKPSKNWLVNIFTSEEMDIIDVYTKMFNYFKEEYFAHKKQHSSGFNSPSEESSMTFKKIFIYCAYLRINLC